ncbi:competence type IV pilus minor pilin ComGG [Lentibacillus jeotgali]|uniref:competence type IV pilus minor pilin ComGG n=1 Tax=Lentibacillus jeotgali TaxID=558169 RepID=UPI000262607C|nr:competence type IV pilus minor pilin ComGG [Lentibacillus jeotgali]
MRKILSFTTDQQGFVLPYVLFFIALALIILTANVYIYQDEIHITQNQTEQLKIETLIQMARMQFKEDISNEPKDDTTIVYDFPYGDVAVKYTKLSEQVYHLYFTIQTDNGTIHSIFNRMTFDSE